MTKLLSEFKVGEEGKIVLVTAEGRIRRRLFDMGVTVGAAVLLRKKAPLGDPYEINIRGYELTLRKSEAACVVMETKTDTDIIDGTSEQDKSITEQEKGLKEIEKNKNCCCKSKEEIKDDTADRSENLKTCKKGCLSCLKRKKED